VPVYEQGRFWSPRKILFLDYEGTARDYIQEFLSDEYETFPVSTHDDMLDCESRIMDPMLGAKFPAMGQSSLPLMMQGKGSVDMVETEYDIFA